MAFKIQTNSFQLAKAETQLGVVARIIGLGSQPNGYFEPAMKQYEEDLKDGKFPKKPLPFKQMVSIAFELPNDLVSSGEHVGKPLMVSKDLELKFSEYKGKKSGLLSLVNSLLKRELTADELSGALDLKSLLGKAALLQIKHTIGKNGKTYANIETVIKADSRSVPLVVSDLVFIDDDTPLSEIQASKLPQFLKDKITAGRIGNIAAQLPEDEKPF